MSKTTHEKIETLANSLGALLQEKNRRYGDSALNPLGIFAGKTLLGDRLDDKLARIKNSPTLRKNDVADAIGYLFLVCIEQGFDDFNDLID